MTTATPTSISPGSLSEASAANRVLWLSTTAFTLMFAVWLMFGILAIPLRDELGLSAVQFSWLAAIAILNGSLWRLVFGILTDRYGGRRVFTVLVLLTAVPTFLVSYAQTYTHLMLCAFLLGLAGNSFSVGIAWNAAWFPTKRQGFALGVFGAGNVGASVTKFIAPVVIAIVPTVGWLGGVVPGGWRFVPFLYGILLLGMAAALWWMSPARDRMPGQGRALSAMLQPLRCMRVWRFSLYYVVVFGAYVALAVWLPRYYQDVYGLALGPAALLTALFIFPASLLRPLGGYFSDCFGARRVMYWVFGGMTAATLLLALPEMHITVPAAGGQVYQLSLGLNVWLFTALLFVVAVGMGIGKAAVYKYIPDYFPKDVGAVGGLVGMLGALGGFLLPPVFAYFESFSGVPQATFFALFVVTALSLLWLHVTVLRLLREEASHVRHEFDLPTASGPTITARNDA
ncbi:nitrate/nitrite transporter [Phycisphaerales bacterium AB-hyl4]|uniref:Nitrate/nitrite transporter n=1 Tax=Natronomicrosphaera hydrolytica TaxID=3242702 RepID=A0ABV4U7M6_9BACT